MPADRMHGLGWLAFRSSALCGPIRVSKTVIAITLQCCSRWYSLRYPEFQASRRVEPGRIFGPDASLKGPRRMTSVPARPGSGPAAPSGSARTRRQGWCGSAIGNAIACAANRIVVLYPQAARSRLAPFNPKGCWDWWGYSGPNYASREGLQIRSVWRMVQALGGAGP